MAHLLLSALRHRAADLGEQAFYLATDTYREALDQVREPLSVCSPTSYAAERFVHSLDNVEVFAEPWLRHLAGGFRSLGGWPRCQAAAARGLLPGMHVVGMTCSWTAASPRVVDGTTTPTTANHRRPGLIAWRSASLVGQRGRHRREAAGELPDGAAGRRPAPAHDPGLLSSSRRSTAAASPLETRSETHGGR